MALVWQYRERSGYESWKGLSWATMSSRNGRESLFGTRSYAQLHYHRRGHSLNGISKDSDDNNLDLFSKTRRTLSVASSDESSDVSVKLGGLSVGSAKLARSGIDDLLSSTDGGKHDYDWYVSTDILIYRLARLMTPPETPACPSSEGESQPTLAPPRRSLTRSTSTTKASRLSVSQSENNGHSRPARSSSVTRPSISSSQYSYSAYSSNRSSSILNTSSASVSSYTRPSSPITRSSSASRPSTPTSRPTASRPSTPSRVRSAPTSSSAEKSKPSQSLRPSTPSSRPQIPANLLSSSVPSARSLSRPSTPTRRNSAPAPSMTTLSSTSSGRVSLNGRSSAPPSRPSSPSPRCRAPPQPVVPPDFPLETPPNLRTTLPDRPVSAGRSRPGASVSLKGNSESQPSVNMPRRQPSPIVTRGRLTTEAAGRSRGLANANGHHADVPEPRKAPHAPEVVARKSVKASTTSIDSSGFGRTISKKSLDMAIKHMDIKNSSGNLRSLSSTLFPQSVRTSTPKSVRGNVNGSLQRSNNVAHFEPMANGRSEVDERQYSAKLSEVDMYESSRYDTILLKEDLKNTNWLLSADDKCDQGPIFDNGFESLPEPFGLL
ncbi:mucin-5AC isoform X2 [Senna tora]|uniref:Mucin-5AC isoform X2 n=1 Tax=Senna tora TaxID=362788 RepID=A0A835CJ65_9FABA|nr:mucin-5AC isoform X2 [Senna tora]